MLPADYVKKAQEQTVSHWLVRDSHVSRICEILAEAKVNPIGLRLLDIGCAQGREVVLLNELGLRAQGFDKNPDFIEEARKQSPEYDFTLGDLSQLPAPYSPGSFAIVTCFNTLFYVDAIKVIPGIRALLSPGGVGVITLDSRIDDLEKGEIIHKLDIDLALTALPDSKVFFRKPAERVDETPFRHKHYYEEIGFQAL